MAVEGVPSTGQLALPALADGTAWWSRSSYFWSFAGVGSLTPYTTLYFRDLGFSGLQVGILAALPSLFVAVCGPLWGSTADARGAHRFVLRTAQVLAALTVLVIAQITHFWAMAVLVGLLAYLNAPISPILDSYGVTISERLSVSYGGLRVWGSVGYSATAFTVGRIMGEDVTNLFLIAYAVCLGLGLLSSLGLPPQEERAHRSVFSGIGLLRHNRPLLGLMLVAYLVSSGGAIMYGFLGIHLKDLGGITGSLIGGALLDEVGTVWLFRGASALMLITLAGFTVALRQEARDEQSPTSSL